MTTEQAITVITELRAGAPGPMGEALDIALDALKTRNNGADAIIGQPVYKIRIRRRCPEWTRWGRNCNRKEWRWLAENGGKVKNCAAMGDCTFEIEERVGTKTDVHRLGDVVFLTRADAEKRLKILLGGKE